MELGDQRDVIRIKRCCLLTKKIVKSRLLVFFTASKPDPKNEYLTHEQSDEKVVLLIKQVYFLRTKRDRH
jgi:hypothetical protein